MQTAKHDAYVKAGENLKNTQFRYSILGYVENVESCAAPEKMLKTQHQKTIQFRYYEQKRRKIAVFLYKNAKNAITELYSRVKMVKNQNLGIVYFWDFRVF